MDWPAVENEIGVVVGRAKADVASRFGLDGSEAEAVFVNAVAGSAVADMQRRAVEDEEYRCRLQDAYIWCEENLAAERRAWRRLQNALEWPEGSGMRINQLGKAANELGIETSSMF